MKNEYTPLQTKWLEALESGEYNQCPYYLRDGESYCCLGVATLLVNDNHPALNDDDWDQSVGNSGGDQFSPYDVVSAMGFRTRVGGEYEDDAVLSEKNDNGETFAEIAAFVRASPHLVFTNFEEPTA